jgi:hypothetical protein
MLDYSFTTIIPTAAIVTTVVIFFYLVGSNLIRH